MIVGGQGIRNASILSAICRNVPSFTDVIVELTTEEMDKGSVLVVKRRFTQLLLWLRKQIEMTSQSAAVGQHISHLFRRAIFTRMHYRPAQNALIGESLLGRVLLCGNGDCVGLTSLYVALARELGVPMYAVLYKDHMVSLCLSGSAPLLVETTRSGKTYSGSACIQWIDGIPHISFREGWARILTDSEFLGVICNNMAVCYMIPRGRVGDAAKNLLNCKRLFPSHPDIEHNLVMMQTMMIGK